MKHNLESLELRNFYSFKKAELNFSSLGSSILISGENKDTGGSNGSGKSALFEAVIFALTGRTARKSIEDALINDKSKKNLLVTLTLNNGYYKILRGKRPTHLQFFANGEDYTQESQKATQDFIEKTLEFNYESLLSTVLFGQNSLVDFINSPAETRKLILRHFLGLEKYIKYRSAATSLKLSSLAKVKEFDVRIDELENLGLDLNEKIARYDTEKSIFLDRAEAFKHWESFFTDGDEIRRIIQSNLNEFNSTCNRFLSALTDKKYQVVFDDLLLERVFFKGKHIYNQSLSSGEKQKINLAVLLTLNSRSKFGFIFCDEIVENIDPKGVKNLYILLQELKQTRKIFLITHNVSLQSLLNDASKINIVKRFGVSRIK